MRIRLGLNTESGSETKLWSTDIFCIAFRHAMEGEENGLCMRARRHINELGERAKGSFLFWYIKQRLSTGPVRMSCITEQVCSATMGSLPAHKGVTGDIF